MSESSSVRVHKGLPRELPRHALPRQNCVGFRWSLGIGQDRQLFVAETDGLIVGCAGWRGENLRHVYVALETERGGLGTRLATTSESDFRDRTSGAEIHVGSVLYARRFYESLGYELVTEDRAGSEPFQMKKCVDVAR